jgi:predicted ATPase/DNA-binding CsgD family transcriptional regulator
MSDALAGTVTFVFAEIVRTPRPHPRLASRVPEVVLQRRRVLRAALERAGGRDVRSEENVVVAAFPTATEALAAAVRVARGTAPRRRPAAGGSAVRMGLATVDLTQVSRAGFALDLHPAARVCAAAHAGQILLAASTQESLDALPSGVSVRSLGTHRLRDLRHVEPLFQATHADLPADFPPPRSLDTLPNNLSLQLTSFVGREREIMDIGRLLGGARVLTLTGAGGCGKTRLAMQVAAAALDGYPDGVWVVEFAPVAEASLVAPTIAAALAVPEQPDRRVVDTLVDALRSRVVLLLLDNCEHLLAACAETAATLLQRCPTLQVLATSQEALGIAGEVTYAVPPLSLPPARPAPTPEGLCESESVRLFVDRAALARPGFALTSANGARVLEICRRLDGMPLALELAAACLKVLTVEQVAERLYDRFRLLSGGSRTGLPRHQTLRAVMDWSYDVLAPQEKALLRRLSVFAGGWTLEAAESICAGGDLEGPAILGLLGRLVGKSLVVAETRDREMRYGLLDTVRQYARDRLVEHGEAPQFRARHARWYLLLANRGDPELRGPRQTTWLRRLEAEHDNFRAALEWSRADAAGAGTAVELAAALSWFWFMHGHWSEGRGWLEEAWAMSTASGGPGSPKVLLGAGHLARQQGDYAQATALLEHGLALCEQAGQAALAPSFLIHLGLVASYEGDAAKAKSLFAQSLTRSRTLDDRWVTSMSLAQLGGVHVADGDYTRAAALLNESLTLAREVGDEYRTAFALRGLGTVALRQGECTAAAVHYRESLVLSRNVREAWVTEESLVGLAGVAAALGYGKRAGHLFGAAEVLCETLGLHRLAADQTDYAERVAAVRHSLGEAEFKQVWAEGRAMGLARAVDLALAPLKAVVPGDGAAAARTAALEGTERLTRRERDVAALVAQGQTNREIASRLVISERTADTHLQNILSKLGFSSRAQIAAWAVEHGLRTTSEP